MRLAAGRWVGAYEIASAIGAGGMGEVYRARDTRLKRNVALKILPESFASDPERLARFQREAEVLASLNHPNIAAIYGVEESDGIRALVMELVDGETLADRITRGPIPIDEAIPIAKQIAEALEGAHERGIIHRDLKPANIKICGDGTVKVLDFGLAKLEVSSGSSTSDASLSPTITSPAMMTGVGVLLGTAAYMSPEQARGKAADKRSDMWAFGCVLFEMLTGTRVFDGDTVNDMLAAVLRGEPQWDLLPLETPDAVRVLIRRCLQKDPRKRIAEATTAALLIEEPDTFGRSSAAEQAVTQRQVERAESNVRRDLARAMRRRVLAGGIAALLAVFLAGAVVWFLMRPEPPQVYRWMVTPSGTDPLILGSMETDLAITPDGRRLIYHSANHLIVQTLDRLEPTVLSGVGVRTQAPFVSSDSQWVGFFDERSTLKKVPITGGPPVTIAESDGFGPRGATWGEDGSIVYATSSFDTGLKRVSSAGGMPTVLTKPDPRQREVDHFWPEFLPGGQAVLFTIAPASGSLSDAQVAVLDLRTGSIKRILRGGHHAHYVSTGHVVYGAGGTVRAVPFDLARLDVTGTSVPILESVVTTPDGGIDVAIAATGTLVYVPARGSVGAQRSLVWVDRTGGEEPLPVPVRAYQYLRISPDGTRVALDIRDQDRDIWIWTFADKILTRLTFDPAADMFPVWTPDSRRVVFGSLREGSLSLYWQAADGTGSASLLTKAAAAVPRVAASSSPDGKLLLVNEMGSLPNLLILPLDTGAGHAPRPLIQTPAAEANGEISPDGRWLAYQSDDRGRSEIYVRPFPDINGGRWQVSTGGGQTPLWSRSGDELFFRSADAAIMGVRVKSGPSWSAGQPMQLVRPGGYFQGNAAFPRQFDVSPDGRRFLVIKEANEGARQAPNQIAVVLNWQEELKRLVPTR
jgi:serine/threonine-protein kinase